MNIPGTGEWPTLFATGGLSFAVGIYIMKWIGSGARWLVELLVGRHDKREADIDAGMKELLELHKAEIAVLKTDCDGFRERLGAAETRVNQAVEAHLECERRLTAVEGRAAKAEATLQGYGDARNMMQVERAAEKLDTKKG